LRQLYMLLVRGKIEGCSLQRFEAATGLKLMDANGIKDDLPPITTFLNRMLALTIETTAPKLAPKTSAGYSLVPPTPNSPDTHWCRRRLW
jgi:hypothetical protein